MFAAALFTSALLLFLVQPMFARMALPLLGGSPAVWTTCMLFFQGGLLAGYAYVHVTALWLPLRAQVILQAVLFLGAIAVLPFGIPEAPAERIASRPTIWLLGALSASVGLPFFVLSTSAPLLQRWFSVLRHAASGDPYFLYAASNAGSLAALLAYPIVVEPLLTLGTQRKLWALGYGVTAALVLVCAAAAWRMAASPSAMERTSSSSVGVAPTLGARLRWLALSFVPSGLMLAVTMYLTSDVAVVPMFWIVPLALYLVTFIVAFSRATHRVMALARRLLPLVLLPVVLFLMLAAGGALAFILPLHLLTFTLLALLCHGELAASRPPAAHLTEFYLWIALGGMLGGVLNGIVAPAVFTSAAEYPLLLAAACFALASRREAAQTLRQPRTLIRPLTAAALAWAVLLAAGRLRLEPVETLPFLGLSALLCFSVSRHAARFAIGIALLLAVGSVHTMRAWGHVVEAERTFFGIYRVSEDRERGFVTLFHGTTVHGRQVAGAAAPEPLTYYHRDSPIGHVFSARAAGTPLRVGVVGLGVGSLAAYAEPRDQWRFYEIDPVVERIARDARYFGFLERCAGACDVSIGDARLSLEREAGSSPEAGRPATHDILVLDAFSSDAIPLHLLTREAVGVYLSRLSDDGLLAFHISNRHVDLAPALARVARDHSLVALERRDVRAAADPRGYSPSEWLVMSRSSKQLERLSADPRWMSVRADTRRAWTDDFSNIWTVLRWRGP